MVLSDKCRNLGRKLMRDHLMLITARRALIEEQSPFSIRAFTSFIDSETVKGELMLIAEELEKGADVVELDEKLQRVLKMNEAYMFDAVARCACPEK